MVNTAAIFLSTFSGLKEQGKFTFLWYNHRAGRRGKKFISSKEKRAPINSLQRSGVGKIAYSIPFNYQKLSKEITGAGSLRPQMSKFLMCSLLRFRAILVHVEKTYHLSIRNVGVQLHLMRRGSNCNTIGFTLLSFNLFMMKGACMQLFEKCMDIPLKIQCFIK